MPRPTTALPTADELLDRLDDHPPWRAVSSVELAQLLGVRLNWVWNNVMRGTGPEPEPGDAHVRASNRRFFLPCVVLEWLSARDGARISAWAWNRRWLDERGLLDVRDPDPGPTGVLRLIRVMEGIRGVLQARRWKVRRSVYDARLEALHGDLATRGAERTLRPRPSPPSPP